MTELHKKNRVPAKVLSRRIKLQEFPNVTKNKKPKFALRAPIG